MTNQQTTATVDRTPAEQALAELIVSSLQLEVAAADIEPEARLFGEGLGLDSIDALELATAIARKFDIKVSQDQDTRDAFRSVNHLAAFITAQRS